ncbi:hypothetical protein Q7C36_010316 [Tachysurus vachellii]|uniref:Uncharacterized protein n=1 Tax=Tachysurus vachellii TaxID=175792 RepID=A0AA88SPW0_TACVA|nr:hypothetical protein Q7C36_010316 [Tachysurus vachellii]
MVLAFVTGSEPRPLMSSLRREFKRSGHQMTPAMAESPAFVRMSARTIPTAIFMLPHHLPPASERLH